MQHAARGATAHRIVGTGATQSANSQAPEKWPLKWCMFVCDSNKSKAELNTNH